MKTSPLPPKNLTGPKRHSVAFMMAAAVYAPLIVALCWTAPALQFKAAGSQASLQVAFSQFAGGGSAASTPAPTPTPIPEPEPEATPEPVSPPPPTPVPDVVKAPDFKKAFVERQKAREARRERVERSRQLVKQTRTMDEVRERQARRHAQQKVAHNAAAGLTPTPTPAAQPGGASRAAQGGIATLEYGKVDDPFLTRVKQSVEGALRYPRKARVMRQSGVTVLEFSVTRDGVIENEKIYKSSGFDSLDRAALRAVFDAQSDWGKPQKAVRLRFPIAFELRRMQGARD